MLWTQPVGLSGFDQSRSVVFKLALLLVIVQSDPPQPVSVGKFSQRPELFGLQGGLQLVGDFHQRHGPHYSRTTPAWTPVAAFPLTVRPACDRGGRHAAVNCVLPAEGRHAKGAERGEATSG